MATQTASEMLKEIVALETFSKTTFSEKTGTIIWTKVPVDVEVLSDKIKIHYYAYRNGEQHLNGLLELKPTARVKRTLVSSGFKVTRPLYKPLIDFVPDKVVQLKVHLLLAARYEKLKALID